MWQRAGNALPGGPDTASGQIVEGFHCEIAGDAHPSSATLVQLAHARALREEWVSPSEIRPVYLRQPDAQINWASRTSAGIKQ